MNSIREVPSEYLNSCPVIDQKYKVLFKLGSGRFSKVKMAIKLDTNERVAVKIMNQKLTATDETPNQKIEKLRMFLNEIKMCGKSKHKYVVEIIDFKVGGVYRTADGRVKHILYYVMKMANNGQLYRIIKETQIFTEKISRYIFKQLITSLEYLHSRGIAHRDLKTQNILIDQKMNIKIADFGYACDFLDCKLQKIKFDASDEVGTTKCNAPELTNWSQIHKSYYADQVDLFACGCILFQMVMKAPPFQSSNYKDKFYDQLIKEDKTKFWDIFSPNCCPSNQFRDIIQKLLNPDPKSRLTLEGVKQHAWMKGQSASREVYRKDIGMRLKKVTVKIRKEQQQQIKALFKKERTKSQQKYPQQWQIKMSRQMEEQILSLQEIINVNKAGQSDSSSSADLKQQEERIMVKKVSQ